MTLHPSVLQVLVRSNQKRLPDNTLSSKYDEMLSSSQSSFTAAEYKPVGDITVTLSTIYYTVYDLDNPT